MNIYIYLLEKYVSNLYIYSLIILNNGEIFKKFIFLYNSLRCSSNCQKQLYLFYILENLINYKENIFFNYRG